LTHVVEIERHDHQRSRALCRWRDRIDRRPLRDRSRRRIGPVAVERRGEFFDDGWGVNLREADVPLHAVEQRGFRQIGRSDEGGGEAALAVKEPRLGVQAGVVGLVRDLDLGAELDEAIDGFAFSGADVGRRDDAQLAAAARREGEVIVVSVQRGQQFVDDLGLFGDALFLLHLGQRLPDDGGEVAGEGEVGVGLVELLLVCAEPPRIERTQLALDLVGDRDVVQAGREFGHLCG
jgi:hypothetical protein